MAYSDISADTLPVDGAPATQVPAGTIVVASAANPGSAAVSGAKATGLIGITAENTDGKGYARIATRPGNLADCISGGVVAFGNLVASDANGHGVAVTPLNAGALTQIVGIADGPAAAAGVVFQVRLLPSLGLS